MQAHLDQAQTFIQTRTGSVIDRRSLCATLRTACDKLNYGDALRGSALRVASVLEAQTRNLQSDFLDFLLEFSGVKNDSALSAYLGLAPPQTSKYRHAINAIGSALILRIHDITGLEVRDLKRRLCIPCAESMVPKVTQ